MYQKLIKSNIMLAFTVLFTTVTSAFSQVKEANNRATKDTLMPRIEEMIKKQFDKGFIKELAREIVKEQRQERNDSISSRNRELTLQVDSLGNQLRNNREESRICANDKDSCMTALGKINNLSQKLQNDLNGFKEAEQRSWEQLARVICMKNTLVSDELIEIVLAQVQESASLSMKLKDFKETSKRLKAAIAFLDEGVGDFNVVYENLKQPISNMDFPEQYKLQQVTLERYKYFIKVAGYLDALINKIAAVTSKEQREFQLTGFEYFYAVSAYCYLNKVFDQNFIKHTPLGIQLPLN